MSSDRRIRKLERAAAAGDPGAQLELARQRTRHGVETPEDRHHLIVERLVPLLAARGIEVDSPYPEKIVWWSNGGHPAPDDLEQRAYGRGMIWLRRDEPVYSGGVHQSKDSRALLSYLIPKHGGPVVFRAKPYDMLRDTAIAGTVTEIVGAAYPHPTAMVLDADLDPDMDWAWDRYWNEAAEQQNPGPDERIRRLERRARAGDPGAERRFQRELERARRPDVLWVGAGGILAARQAARDLGGPFRAPHHTASTAAVIAEADRARGGVLVLDGVDQFRPHALAGVRDALKVLEPRPVVWATLSIATVEHWNLPNWVKRFDVRNAAAQNPPPEISFANWHVRSDREADYYTLWALTPEGHDELRKGILDQPTEDMILGYVYYAVLGDKTAFVNSIWVRPDLRRQGLGTALWRELEQRHPGYQFPARGLTDEGAALRKAVGRNPDSRERELERAWRAGDPQAGGALLRMIRRRGPKSYTVEDMRLVTSLREAIGDRCSHDKDKRFSRIRRELRAHGVGEVRHREHADLIELRRHSLDQLEDWLGREGGGYNSEWTVPGSHRIWYWEDWGEPNHQAVFVSPQLQAILTYTEGDVTVELAHSIRDYVAIYRAAEAFYAGLAGS